MIMRTKERIRFSLLTALVATLFTACATKTLSTPLYGDVKGSLLPQPGKGLVLFYCKMGHVERGFHFQIYNNNEKLTDRFMRGTFFSYQAEPGQLNINTSIGYSMGNPSWDMIPKDQPPLQVAAGQTYYVEMQIANWTGNEFMVQVSKEEGEAGLTQCHWLNPQ